MKLEFTKSIDDVLRISLRVCHRLDIDDLIEVCLQNPECIKSKSKLATAARIALQNEGESLRDPRLLDGLVEYSRVTEVATEEDIERCRIAVLKLFPELNLSNTPTP